MSTPIDAALREHAHATGVRVEYAALRPGRDGEYAHTNRSIHLRPGMHARLHRSVLAHELGHAILGHTAARSAIVHAKQERLAEEWAALHLITPTDYRHAERTCEGHPGAMALELGVMRSTVVTYRSLLQRIRRDETTCAVYIDARMGAGMWAHREDVA